MTKAGWTSEKPTAAGWYWIRAPKHGWRDCVLWVDQDDDGFYIDVGDCDTEYVTDIDAEWLGPITPTDDAALRRAKAEGLRLAVQEHRCWEDVLRTEYRNVPTFEAWIDARAAQIEEGE